jgi:hypothetical protein
MTSQKSTEGTRKPDAPAADSPRSTNPSMLDAPLGEEPQGIQHDVAEADKKARTGKQDEPVRNSPPAGAWNDTSHD